MLHKCCFWVIHILENYFVELCFLKKYCVVTLLYMIIYEKCIIFGIAYGEMHEYLTWKRKGGGHFCLEWETLVLPSPFLRASHIEEDSFPPLSYKRELKRKEYHQSLITDGTPISFFTCVPHRRRLLPPSTL